MTNAEERKGGSADAVVPLSLGYHVVITCCTFIARYECIYVNDMHFSYCVYGFRGMKV